MSKWSTNIKREPGEYIVTIKKGSKRYVKYAELIEYPIGHFTWHIQGEPERVEIIATQKWPKPYMGE